MSPISGQLAKHTDNAISCGLRYARSRAKKEGLAQNQRRRKEKGSGTLKRDISTTQISVPYSYELRRSYDDNSFTTAPIASSGGSVYSHGSSHMLESVTPSPSPPGSNVSFMHYSANGDSRAPSSYGSSPTFYSAPSELSNASPTACHDHAPQQFTQLPPLGHISAYADRLSPMLPSASPMAYASTAPAPSFERDRDRDGCLKSAGSKEWLRNSAEAGRDYHDMPPTPLSAEPRMKRTLLSHQ